MKITQVQFRTNVNIGAIATDFYDVSKPEHAKITVVEKGNFLILTGIPGFPPNKRRRVPMSNVGDITEIDEEAPAKPKEEPSGTKIALTPGRPDGSTTPPLPAARGLNAPAHEAKS